MSEKFVPEEFNRPEHVPTPEEVLAVFRELIGKEY
jgi:hypothetical protein